MSDASEEGMEGMGEKEGTGGKGIRNEGNHDARERWEGKGGGEACDARLARVRA